MLQWSPICLATGLHASVWWASLWTLDRLQCWLLTLGPFPKAVSELKLCPRVWWESWLFLFGKSLDCVARQLLPKKHSYGSSKIDSLSINIGLRSPTLRWNMIRSALHNALVWDTGCMTALVSDVDPWHTAVQTFRPFRKPRLDHNLTRNWSGWLRGWVERKLQYSVLEALQYRLLRIFLLQNPSRPTYINLIKMQRLYFTTKV